MKDFFTNKSVKILAVTMAIVIVISILGATGNPVVSTAVGFITNGLSQVTSALGDATSQKTYEELEKENTKLKKENADLRTQLVDYYNIKDENARLWKYYKIKKQNPDYELVPASVIRRDSSSDFYSFTVDVGSTMGVSVQDPVVTENGLVGFVSSVNGANCKVTTILSPETQAGALDKKTKDSGIISGSAVYSDKNLTTLTKVNTTSTIAKGDIIVTSGIGGVYPANLIVGKVKSVKFDKNEATKYTVVEPYDDIRTLTEVVIITDFKNQGEIKE
jgi:rod shape-determining protein MreC